MSNGIWVEVVASIERMIPRIFLPAIPDIFYQNYTRTLRFITAFEKFVANKTQLVALRASVAFVKFKKKWDLNSDSYFQLRLERKKDKGQRKRKREKRKGKQKKIILTVGLGSKRLQANSRVHLKLRHHNFPHQPSPKVCCNSSHQCPRF